MAPFGKSNKPADKADVSWQLDKSGRWSPQSHPDSYVLKGWTSTQIGRVEVAITISKATGEITSKSYTVRGRELDGDDLNQYRSELTMNLGGVVLKQTGKVLPARPKIYNEIAP